MTDAAAGDLTAFGLGISGILLNALEPCIVFQLSLNLLDPPDIFFGNKNGFTKRAILTHKGSWRRT